MNFPRIIFVLAVVLTACIGLLIFRGNDPVVIIIVAGLLIFSLLSLRWLYKSVRRPLNVVASGLALLRGKDFSSRLAYVGEKDADKIIEMYNTMIRSLNLERRRLREQNHFLDLLIDVSTMGIIILDPDEEVVQLNRAALSFLGIKTVEEIKYKKLEVFDSKLCKILSSLKEGEINVVRLPDSMVYRCSRLQFMERGIKHPFIIVDKLTEEVMRAERKSYEKVIRMMAHEVNNSLGGMKTVLEIAAAETPDAELKDALADCGRRCMDLSAFITKFASAVKIPTPHKDELDLAQLLRSRSREFEWLCSAEGARLTMDFPDEKIMTRADPVLIEQTIMNIVKNGAESASKGGEVCISLSGAGILTVSDNGPGISKDVSEMLFTPFFTTKKTGHGLGLLFVSEVLNEHSFRFSLETGEDGITRFTIRF